MDTAAINAALTRLGYSPDRAGIVVFPRAKGLAADGIAGPKTQSEGSNLLQPQPRQGQEPDRTLLQQDRTVPSNHHTL